MNNPFEIIEQKLEKIEALVLEMQEEILGKVRGIKPVIQQDKIVDLDGLLEARPFIGSKSTVYKKVMNKKIPHSKRGKRLIFNLDEIDKWLESNVIVANTELKPKEGNQS